MPARDQDLAYVSRTTVINLSAPPDEVFELFGPDREGDWAWGWHPEPVYPRFIVAQEGAVFRTLHHGDAETVWVISEYDPERRIVKYITFRHDDRVGRISIQVEAGVGGSQACVTYTFVALSAKGRRHVAHFTDAHYRQMMTSWERTINYYLETGATLKL